MSTAQCPLHRLLLDEALADDLINSRFDEGRADRLAVPVSFPKVRNELAVVANVSLKLRQTVSHFLRGHRMRLDQTEGPGAGPLCAPALLPYSRATAGASRFPGASIPRRRSGTVLPS